MTLCRANKYIIAKIKIKFFITIFHIFCKDTNKKRNFQRNSVKLS